MATKQPAQATIITLDYGPDHLEFSVVIHQPDWETLVPLLEDPKSYLETLGKSWPQGGIEPPAITWTVRTPCVAIIEPLIARPDLSAALYQAYGTEEFKGHRPDRDAWQDTLMKLWQKQPYRDGMYVAEFALSTGTITISYLPPFDGPTSLRYTGGFTTSNISLSDVGGDGCLCEVHVDLDRGGQKISTADRANSIVDFLECRDRFLDILNRTPAKFRRPSLAAFGQPIKIDLETATAPPLDEGIYFESAVPKGPQTGKCKTDFCSCVVDGLCESTGDISPCLMCKFCSSRVIHEKKSKKGIPVVAYVPEMFMSKLYGVIYATAIAQGEVGGERKLPRVEEHLVDTAVTGEVPTHTTTKR